MTYPIRSFYDLKAAVRALEAAQVEDNTDLRFAVETGEHYGGDATADEIIADGPLTSITLERGTRPEIVLR